MEITTQKERIIDKKFIMAFYGRDGNQITIEEWIQIYEPPYFLDTPNIGRKITKRNKSSRYVENLIEQILINGLTVNDIIFVIAWKIGAIDHTNSQERVIYKKNFNNTL